MWGLANGYIMHGVPNILKRMRQTSHENCFRVTISLFSALTLA